MVRTHKNNYSINMSAGEFRREAYALVDQIASFMRDLPARKVTRGEDMNKIRGLLKNESLPLWGNEYRQNNP